MILSASDLLLTRNTKRLLSTIFYIYILYSLERFLVCLVLVRYLECVSDWRVYRSNPLMNQRWSRRGNKLRHRSRRGMPSDVEILSASRRTAHEKGKRTQGSLSSKCLFCGLLWFPFILCSRATCSSKSVRRIKLRCCTTGRIGAGNSVYLGEYIGLQLVDRGPVVYSTLLGYESVDNLQAPQPFHPLSCCLPTT